MSEALVPTPKDAGQQLADQAKLLTKYLDDQLTEAYENGFLILGKSKPAERWRWFQEHTLPGDYAKILDAHYLERRRTGESPVFDAELLMQDYALQVAQAIATGMPPPPDPMWSWPWPVVLAPEAATILFTLFQRDFTRLYNAEVRKMAEVAL